MSISGGLLASSSGHIISSDSWSNYALYTNIVSAWMQGNFCLICYLKNKGSHCKWCTKFKSLHTGCGRWRGWVVQALSYMQGCLIFGAICYFIQFHPAKYLWVRSWNTIVNYPRNHSVSRVLLHFSLCFVSVNVFAHSGPNGETNTGSSRFMLG